MKHFLGILKALYTVGEINVVVYADVVFLLNSCIDFLLLWLTAGIRKQPLHIWRMGCAAIIGGIYSMLSLWPPFSFLFSLPIKILVSMVMVVVGLGYFSIYAYLRNLATFYLTCFVAGGAMIALHFVLTGNGNVSGGILFTSSSNGWGSPVSWIFIWIGFPLVWLYTKFSLGSLKERQEMNQFVTAFKMVIMDQIVTCNGLIDTGNQLRDPISRQPVILVELKLIEALLPPVLIEWIRKDDFQADLSRLPLEWMSKVRIIPYRAAGRGHSMMIAFKPDWIEVKKDHHWYKFEKILIGIDVGNLSTDRTYQAIIHPSCYPFTDTMYENQKNVEEAHV
ncbi:sigma-E processing peptidase SpoIIGA [Hazenella sp. IB182357]|uniref:Sigma-E processing peptidase SpoIIGA n=1 Tax=Polycladospora coralii TaxID=2771432 RepID=A0A926ND89_9BACL|nr:sigma-E processing peptidase SpoIIGA [Polycladospora coralii]MBD1371328.1 sigma-E processing peptidase SpoIIGA [Polycladospora coralii]MBS7530296.1 sigma-E processing peptidase SpoIIGA [Polycladospora coralii]